MGFELGDPSSLDRVDLLDLLGLGDALRALDLDAVARVAAVDPRADSPHEVEQALVARAVPARRAELLSGRNLARTALAALEVDAGAIGRRPDRSPDWPAGTFGSITHSAGLVAVVVARPRHPGAAGHPHPRRIGSDRRVGVGLDVERDQLLAPEIATRVLGSDERVALAERQAEDAVVVFTAKEAVFKALNPLTGRWLEPEHVSVRLGSDTFEAELVAAGAEPDDPGRVQGGWVRQAGWVFAGCVTQAVDPTPDDDQPDDDQPDDDRRFDGVPDGGQGGSGGTDARS